jgi:hypothetical protein
MWRETCKKPPKIELFVLECQAAANSNSGVGSIRRLWDNRVGVAIAVKLKKDSQWYASHHHIPEWSIQRDRPAATTVELPFDTTRDDIEAIKAIAIPLGWTVSNPYKIALTKINRAFFLDNNYLPQQSFIDWRGEIILTSEHPEAIVWNN